MIQAYGINELISNDLDVFAWRSLSVTCNVSSVTSHWTLLTLAYVTVQEWRHAHGMRCLGVPNTAHFANVTLIEDAIARMSSLSSLCYRKLYLVINCQSNNWHYWPVCLSDIVRWLSVRALENLSHWHRMTLWLVSFVFCGAVHLTAVLVHKALHGQLP